MKIIKPPHFIPNNLACVFLAGSIEMGAAENWQDKITAMLDGTPWTVLNPRRDDWDSSWVQSIGNPQFFEQVNWELQGIEVAEHVIVYFDPSTKSPITLMELGLLAGRSPEKAIVICPDGYWRRGNVQVVCDRYRMTQVSSLEGAISILNRASFADRLPTSSK